MYRYAGSGVVESEPSCDHAICAMLSRPGARTARFAACRSVSAKFLLSLPLPPVVSCRLRKAACLLQIASEIFLKATRPFPVPEQSSQDARGILQTLPIRLLLPLL